MELTDTHCHIHSTDYPLGSQLVLSNARQSHVTRLICVGQTLADSELAIQFSNSYDNIWSSIGVHPHEAKDQDWQSLPTKLSDLAGNNRVVALGECGLDYFYNHSSKEDQIKLLKIHLEVASQHNLPLVFHVREAFDDFWPIFDSYKVRGILHSFTANKSVLNEALTRNLLISLNGIMTFTKQSDQLEMAKTVPLNRLVVETDAPYLTPVPFRGQPCQPKHVLTTATFLSELRHEGLEAFATATTNNAINFFNL